MATQTKRLYRSRHDRMIGGLCGGLGEYFGIDPTVVRLLFVLATLVGGHGILAYLILLVIVPLEPAEQTTAVT
jgi:phage shock protein C